MNSHGAGGKLPPSAMANGLNKDCTCFTPDLAKTIRQPQDRTTLLAAATQLGDLTHSYPTACGYLRPFTLVFERSQGTAANCHSD